MGKYMRKCRAPAGGGKAAPAAVEHRAPVALGVRTRSRAAASDEARRRKRAATASTTVEDALLGRDGGDKAAGCYLQLRSRRLFMPSSAKVEEVRGHGAGEGEAEASTARLADSGHSVEDGAVAGVSRCSSTASTAADVVTRERSGNDAEVCESRNVESSVSDSECGGRRERRETTPSSRSPVDSSDPESSKATDEQKRKRRRYPAATAAFRLDLEARPRTPPAAEVEEFFAAAEKAQAQRFAAKYNFDVARGVPLNAGRFDWTPV